MVDIEQGRFAFFYLPVDQRSNTKVSFVALETHTHIVFACSAALRHRSRWSGSPPRTRVAHIEHSPRLQS